MKVALYVMECSAALDKVVIDGVPYAREDLRLLEMDFRAKVVAVSSINYAGEDLRLLNYAWVGSGVHI